MDRHVSSLDEASFAIAGDLMKLAQTEGRLPRITGIHSIVPIGDGEVSIWLALDDPNANEGNGVLWCHVDERALLGVDRDEIFRVLMCVCDACTKH